MNININLEIFNKLIQGENCDQSMHINIDLNDLNLILTINQLQMFQKLIDLNISLKDNYDELF